MGKLIIGVDLGASKVLIGVSDINGNIIDRLKFPTDRNRNAADIIDEIIAKIDELKHRHFPAGQKPLGIAAATPGPLSYPEAIVKGSPNLNWQHIALRDELSRRLGQEVIVEKDTNMAVLGEYYFGQDKHCEHLLYLTVSTGVGGGIILGGRLYRGSSGGAGEFGHMVVNLGGARCGCGRHGCLEAEVSGLAIARQAREKIDTGKGEGILACVGQDGIVSSLEVGLAARRGDKEALDIVSRTVDYLGIGISNLINILNPQMIVLGGGVIFGMKDLIMNKLRKDVLDSVFALHAENLDIRVSRLGEDIGILGCAAAVIHNKAL